MQCRGAVKKERWQWGIIFFRSGAGPETSPRSGHPYFKLFTARIHQALDLRAEVASVAWMALVATSPAVEN